MSGQTTVDLREVAGLFPLPGEFRGGRPHGEGRIHRSFVTERDEGGRTVRFLHQWLNEVVLDDLGAVMGNIARVLDHLRGKRPEREVLRLVPARDGRTVATDASGRAWRTWVFVDGARSHRSVRSLDHAREAARAFGRFVHDLADLPPPPLPETIPGFHDTPAHLRRLEAAIRVDLLDRAAAAAEEIDLARDLSDGADVVVRGVDAGLLPLRPCHHDTKLDNVLIDDRSGRAVAVVDLDTVMPGSVVTDFGDLVRSATKPGTEEEATDGALDLAVFRAVAEGWLEGTGGLLLPAEVGLLPRAGRIIALELGSRFLTDFLTGDLYFRGGAPGENLHRARIQLRHAEALRRAEPEMRAVVKGLA